MKIICLGAGQDVGRSCIIIHLHKYTIMLDCGIHMGYTDHRKYPNFSTISKSNNFTNLIDCIFISHFHLDHSGALPYFTEVLGYSGPVYMTHPTKAITPILLNDLRKIQSRQSFNNSNVNQPIDDVNKIQGQQNTINQQPSNINTQPLNDKHKNESQKYKQLISEEDVENCMNKAVCLNFNETFYHAPDFQITAYPAGHVLGACMFHIKAGNESLIYTGDYNTTPDKHLGSAWIHCLRPDLLITESTYGNLIRDCRKTKERDFLNTVYETVKNGGKVLIPIFALGRAQEMCLLIDSFWERMGLKVPVYLSTGMAEKANTIYKLFISYTNETIKEKILERNLFDYKHIRPYANKLDKGACVIFASPGMLHVGTSLNIFLKICEDERNMVVIPGYCVKNTIGHKILNGEKQIQYRGRLYDVRCAIKNLAFSAHADVKGILEIVKQCQPRNVMLVHGDKGRMKVLKETVEKFCEVTTFMPENGVYLNLPKSGEVEMGIDREVLERVIKGTERKRDVGVKLTAVREVRDGDEKFRIVECEEFVREVDE